jgi:uncharacterized alkaline shock family protein YloU
MSDSEKIADSDIPVKDEEQQKIKAAFISGRIRNLISRTEAGEQPQGAAAGREEKTGEKQPVKGVRVALKDDTALVDVHITAVFGKPIPEKARHIQQEVKNLFHREFAAYHLRAVNIWVDSVSFGKDATNYRDQAIEQLFHGAE